MTQYVQTTSNSEEAAKHLDTGRIVAFPTGTSYGLAADALQGHALQRLRNLKIRSNEKTFTIFLARDLWPKYLALTTAEEKLLAKLDSQPLTLLVQPQQPLEHLAQDDRVGLRLIDHPLMQELADQAHVPLTATSANKAGQPACTTPDCVTQSFPGKVDDTTYNLSLAAILDGGSLPPAEPTTIAAIKNGHLEIIRQGSVTQEQLQT